MPDHITAERLTSLFRPRSVALVGASDKSAFSWIAYRNLVGSGLGEHTYLVSRRGTETHGQPTVTSCTQIGEPVDVAYLMVPQAGLLEALDDAAAAGIRNACVLSSGYAEAGKAIVVLKAGSSALSARTAAAHTGALVGDARVIDAVFADLGVIRVDSIGAGMRAASCPTAYINQVMQPVTGYTRASMEQGGVRYIIPGLRQAVVALRNAAWWSDATRARYAETPPAPVPVPAPGRRRGKWSEHAARALLAEAGVPVVPARLAGSADEDAVRAAYRAVTEAAPDGTRIEALDAVVTWREHS